MKNRYFTFLLILGLCVSCHQREEHYTVGVSQCSDDAWRTRMNEEMQREMIFHPDMELTVRQAGANSAVQCLQIDSFIAEGVDMLIVSPNEGCEVEPAITRAYQAGIPVVVADRSVPGDQWTAFVGGDNLQVGRLMGKWLMAQAGDEVLEVVEVMGLQGSTPAVLRHRGMMAEVDTTRVHIRCIQGQWMQNVAFHVMDSLLNNNACVHAIVAQNDLMAQGAKQALMMHNMTAPILGVDALLGKGGGVEALAKGKIDASITYASRGDLVVQVASHILHGEPYRRDTVLQSVLVDKASAEALLAVGKEIDRNIRSIERLNSKLLALGSESTMQSIVLLCLGISWVLIILLLVVGVLIYRYRQRVQKERREHEEKLQRQDERLKEMTSELAKVKETATDEKEFVAKLTREINRLMGQTDFDVDMLSDAMNMSRAGLYRRVKNVMGCSPVELIRHTRLHRAKQMLQRTNLSVQQVAYEVGFTSPSYFAKCYKEMFQISPQEDAKNKS